MSSSASGPEESFEASRPAFQSSDSVTRQQKLEALLQQVLQQTLDTERESDPEPSELEPLAEVARRHRGLPLQFEPVAVELVLAALENHFDRLGTPRNKWRTTAERIAQTLLDDPVSRQRLETLWNRLSAVN